MKNFESAPVKEKIAIRLCAVLSADGRLWDREIRPLLLAKHPGRTEYRWGRMIRSLPMMRRAIFGLGASRCYALGVFTKGHADAAILSGLMLLVEGVKFPATQDECVYVWFLQSAPDTYTLDRGALLTPRSGEALLDAAIVASVKAGYEGRILLHAAPSGKQELLDYYRYFGLKQLPSRLDIAIAGKSNDGRFFVADEGTAAYILRRNNRYR